VVKECLPDRRKRFCHKPKYHHGRAPESEFWEFGIVETSYSPGFDHLEIVNNRCADTLLPIIGRVCMKVW
jgi:hypothetical protein